MKDSTIKLWFVIFGVLIFALILYVYKDTKGLIQIRDAKEALGEKVDDLRGDVDNLISIINEGGADISEDIHNLILKARDHLEELVQKLKSAGEELDETIRKSLVDEIASIKQDARDEAARLQVLYQNDQHALKLALDALELEINQKIKVLEASLSAIESTLSSIEDEYGSVLTFVQNVVKSLCKYPGIVESMAVHKFSIIDAADCTLKAKVADCPRGTYGGICASKMCPGGSTYNGTNYDYKKAGKWCENYYSYYDSDKLGSCDGTTGLCVGKKVVITAK